MLLPVNNKELKFEFTFRVFRLSYILGKRMSQICGNCTQTINIKSPGISCIVCKYSFHIKCTDVNNQHMNLVKIMPDFLWQCLKCRDKEIVQDGKYGNCTG
ncbi:hypothetical protein WA026_012567 [Henosepilachna vigintioctopunctata]|uniref:PHD-type domain-containing protein n=1 Tax=Henosepilachna vigintioctopunctata TaxID=420089 RepID=A0AAW1U5G4_9CUCU